jgi:membrane protease YdiL (CAAX protease family)
MPATPPAPLLMMAGALLGSALLGAWLWALASLAAGRSLLPRRAVVPVPWGGATVLLMFLIWLVINRVAGTLLDATGGAKQTPPDVLLRIMSLVNVATLVALPPALRLVAGARPEHFGLGRGAAPGAELARGVVAGLIVTPAVYAVNFLAVQVWPPRRHPVEEMIRADPSGRVALMAFVSAVLLAPATEELLFRGILQGWLVRLWGRLQDRPSPPPEVVGAESPGSAPEVPAVAPLPAPDRSSPRAAPATLPDLRPPDGDAAGEAVPWPGLLTSLVFAAIHSTEWPAPIPIFVLSLALGAVYQRTGGLLAPFALHATFNGFSTLLLLVALLSGDAPAGPPAP